MAVHFPILNLKWAYTDSTDPDPEELAKDINGRALADIKDAAGAVTLHAGQLLDGFEQLRDDGTTESSCWIFAGCSTEHGNQMARRDATDPREQGITPNWAWPANRRILYNRASADPAGRGWNPAKPIIEWNGKSWTGIDVPDFVATSKPSDGVSPFIMNAEGAGGCLPAKRWRKARSPNTTSHSNRRCLMCCTQKSSPTRPQGMLQLSEGGSGFMSSGRGSEQQEAALLDEGP